MRTHVCQNCHRYFETHDKEEILCDDCKKQSAKSASVKTMADKSAESVAQNFTDRAKRFVNQSPHLKGLDEFKKQRIIRGIAKLLSETAKLKADN